MLDRRGLGGTHLSGTLYSNNLDLIIIGLDVHNLIIIWESFNLCFIRCGSTYNYIILLGVLLINNNIIFFFFLTTTLIITFLAFCLFFGAFYYTTRFLISLCIGRSGMLERTRTWLQRGNLFSTSRRMSGSGRNLLCG